MDNISVVVAARVLASNITVSPPIYRSKIDYAMDLLANNNKQLVSRNSLLQDAIAWMCSYMSKHTLACADLREYKKNLKIVLAKRLPIQRFELLAATMLLFPSFYEKEKLPKQQFPQLEGGAMHNIVAPLLIEIEEDVVPHVEVPMVSALAAPMREDCAVCDSTYCISTICKKCVGQMCIIKHLAGYHSGKFKNDIQALRRYNEIKNTEKFEEYMKRKRNFAEPIARPVVPPQLNRDYDLHKLNEWITESALLTRADQRMLKYIEKLESMMKDKVIAHDSDITQIWKDFVGMMEHALKSGALVLGAVVVLSGAALVAMVVTILKTDSVIAPIMLRVLAALLLVTSILAGVQALFSEPILELATAVEEKRKQKDAVEKGKIVSEVIGTKDSVLPSNEELRKEIRANSIRIENEKDKAFVADAKATVINYVAAQAREGKFLRLDYSNFEGKLKSFPHVYPIDPVALAKLLGKKKEEDKPILVDPDDEFETPGSYTEEDLEKEELAKLPVSPNILPPALIEGDPNRILFKDPETWQFDGSDDEDLTPNIAHGSSVEINTKGVFAQMMYKYLKKSPAYKIAEMSGPPHDRLFVISVEIEGDVCFVSGGHRTKIDGEKAVARLGLKYLEQRYEKVKPHVGEVVEVDMTKAISDLVLATSNAVSGAVSPFAKSTLAMVHSVATSLRDIKSITDILQPVVETAIGAFYERVVGTPWVPWSQRGIHELIKPLLEEHAEIAHLAERAVMLHTNTKFQEKVTAFKKKVFELEAMLTRSRTPPRYLVPVVAMRNDAENWMQLVIAASQTARDRVEPVCILIFGASGVGKTTTMTQLNVDLAPTLHDLDESHEAVWNDNMIYTKKTETEFWDGYKRQRIIGLDDLWQTDEATIRRSESMMVINLVNRAAYQLNMSAVPDKTGVYAEPRIVEITRNGKAKLTNLGVISAMAVDRRIHLNMEMLAVGSPSDRDSWRYNRYGPGGVMLEANITYAKLLAYTRALLYKHARDTDVKITPSAPVAMSQKEMEELGDSLRKNHTELVKQARAVIPDTNGEKVMKKKMNVRPHGGVFGKEEDEEEELMKLATIDAEVAEIVETLDKEDCTSAEEETLNERLNNLAKKLHLDDPMDPVNIHTMMGRAGKIRDYICQLAGDCFSTIKKWTITKWDNLTEWIRLRPGIFKMTLMSITFSAAIASAIHSFKEWIQRSAMAKILIAFSAVALVGSVVAGIYFGVKAFLKEDDVEPHSRTEQERKKEAKAAKAERKKNEKYEVVEGRVRKKDYKGEKNDDYHYNKEGKALPRRMRQKVDSHVKDSDIAVLALVGKNLYTTIFQWEDTVSFGQVLFIKGQYAVVCRHVARKMEKCKMEIGLTQTYALNGVAKNLTLRCPVPRFIHVPDTEITFADFGKHIHLHADISNHLITDADLLNMMEYGVEEITMLFRDPHGERITVSAPRGDIVVMDGIFEEDKDALYLKYEARTTNGASGGPVMTLANIWARKLMGLHAGGAHTTAFDALMTLEMFNKHCGLPHTIEIIPHLAIKTLDCVPPKNQTSPIGVLEHGHSSGGKNPIAPSPLSFYLQNDEIYPTHPTTIPTVMYDRKASEVHEQWTKAGMLPADFPFEEAMLHPRANAYKVAPPFKHIPEDLFDMVFDPDDLPPIPGGEYHLLSPEQAVFGEPRLGIAPIDYTASPGYNWSPKEMPFFNRYVLFGMDKKDPKPTKFDQWHPCLQNAILSYLACIGRGDQPVSVVVDALKAERRGAKRVLGGATRMFYAGSIVQLICSRMFTAHLSSLEKAHPTISTPAVGITPTSKEWTELYHRLSKHPHKIMTDQVNYDMHNQLIFARKMGEEHAHVIGTNTIMSHNFSPIWEKAVGRAFEKEDFICAFVSTYVGSCLAVHVDGPVAYLDAQTTNSGVDRTSQINSYRNKTSIKIVFAVTILENQDKLSEADRQLTLVALFKKHVETALYGDDQLISVSKAIAPLFRPIDYADKTAKILGGKVTKPDKTDITELDGFTPWGEAELLKRAFVMVDGVVFAPLQRKVIEDSLHWVQKSNTAHAIAADTVRSALLEAAIHDREYYDTIYGICYRACKKAGVKFEPLSYNKVRAMYVG